MQIYFALLLTTLNVPLRIGKCTPGGTCTPGWETLCYSNIIDQRSLVNFLSFALYSHGMQIDVIIKIGYLKKIIIFAECS